MAGRISQHIVEAAVALDTTQARVSGHVVEVILPSLTRSPTTITGAGISQDVVEALVARDTTAARISQDVIEVLVADTTQSGGGSGAGPSIETSFGYAV